MKTVEEVNIDMKKNNKKKQKKKNSVLKIKKSNKSLKSNILEKTYLVESCLICFEEFSKNDLIISASHDGIYHPCFYHAKCITMYMEGFRNKTAECMLCRSRYNISIPEIFNPKDKIKDINNNSTNNNSEETTIFQENLIIVFHNNSRNDNNYIMVRASFLTLIICRFYNYPGSTFMGFYMLGLLIGCLFSTASQYDRSDRKRILMLYAIRLILHFTRLYVWVDFIYYNTEHIYNAIGELHGMNLRQ